MQGKIALEEHFAIAETAGDSMGYFPEPVRSEVAARNADIHGRRLSLMDEYGIEMMLLVAQRAGRAGDRRQGARPRRRAQGQRLSGRAGAKAAGPFSGACRACHAGP